MVLLLRPGRMQRQRYNKKQANIQNLWFFPPQAASKRSRLILLPAPQGVQNPGKFRFVFEQIASECGIATRGITQTFGGGLGRSTVAHFARKVRGGRILWRTSTENPTKSCPRALVMFATCSWPSLCEQSELQCWRRNRRLCGPVQISAARALPLTFDISILPLPITQKEPHTARCMAPFVLISVKRYIIG